MRSWGNIAPQCWTGTTGKRLRKHKDARILATHLITGLSANMLGLSYLPIPITTHETGLPEKEVSNAFKVLAEERFAYYDRDTEFVYVPGMPQWQIGELKAHDNRVREVDKMYASLPDNPYLLKGDRFAHGQA